MNATETMALALSLDINLEANPRSLKLKVTPRENITEDLREAISENRVEILRILLKREAEDWLNRVLDGKPPELQKRATEAFFERVQSLETLDLLHSEPDLPPQVVKDTLQFGMSAARKVIVAFEEDRRLRESGIIQSERQVFEMARERTV